MAVRFHQTAVPVMKRYEELAQEIERQIAANVLRPGDRLPSVRQTCKARNLSPSTVFQAYNSLENGGLIRVSARSGYFVNSPSKTQVPEPPISAPPEGARAIGISNLVLEVLGSLRSPQVVPFGSSFPSLSLFPFESLRRALASSMRKFNVSTTFDNFPPGNERLRRQISKRYLMQGLEVPVDEIVLTNGGIEALNLCLQAVTNPGDAVVVECPCSYIALQALERLGLMAIEAPTHPRDGVDLASLAHILDTQRPRACWLMTSFQNPLGCSLPRENKKALAELLSQHGVPLIEDDMLGELYHGTEPPASVKSFDRHGLVMHCSSFSLTLAPGYGVGWVAAGRFANDVCRLKLTTNPSGSIPTQAAITEYLQQGSYDRHLRRMREVLTRQKAAFTDSVSRNFPPGTRMTRPDGGYYIWVDMPWDTADTLTLYREALSNRISIAPGPVFANHGGFRNCLRLNFGHPWTPKTDEAIGMLGRLVNRQAGLG